MIKADELVVANVQSNPFKMPRALVKLDLLAFKNFLPNREMHIMFINFSTYFMNILAYRKHSS